MILTGEITLILLPVMVDVLDVVVEHLQKLVHVLDGKSHKKSEEIQTF